MRASLAEIEKKRVTRCARFFLTGGTGFLGSHIAVELLKKGHGVTLLARSDRQHTGEDRVRGLLDWFGLPSAGRRRLRVVEGDITRPEMGIRPGPYRELLRETDEIIHCASNTAFAERRRAEVEAINGNGLTHVLDFARASGAYFFHHMSTAFVAGKASGLCPEEPVTPREFWNAYEETKCRGEGAAAGDCREAGLRLAIYRPSIVYGDSRTGRSLRFNAVYYPVRTALFIRDLYEKDIRERGGRKAAEMGVRVEADGFTRLPLRIEVARQRGINLIPVDFCTAAFLAILEGAPRGGVFHIVNDRATRIEDIVDYCSRMFRMTGLRTCGPEAFTERPRTPLETLYDRCVEAYGPYMRDTRVFQASKARPFLEPKGIVCPEFDYGSFCRCMRYAVETGWGSRLSG